jgi:hypothetical protein
MPETRTEENHRKYPEASRIVENALDEGATKPGMAQANALAAIWADPAHKIETQGHALTRLSDIWPAVKRKEGAAKWGEYPLFAAIDLPMRRKNLTVYAIKTALGTTVYRCLFDMTKKERDQARESLKDRIAADKVAASDIDHVDKFWLGMGCPADRRPSEYFPKKAVAEIPALAGA